MGVLEYQHMPSLRDVAHNKWLCIFTIQQQLEIPAGTGIRVPLSGTKMLRYHTEMLDARIPMPAASASMLMPSNETIQTNHLIMGLVGEIRTLSLATSCKEGLVWC
jgi:hypothetical protein